ncbi:SH3 domain-containing protein [Glutamicibacter sp.]|uniref:SH3 domain-containing protein n=1 Tax=Glutamicibacter sp. TaxID=1931995 RepID=UPI002B499199|nr:SH3 domain-containing protein [Glutamicibacter sp.]HJX78825.1 SH3 domain-containing protein [Glutamicibacter sp.]
MRVNRVLSLGLTAILALGLGAPALAAPPLQPSTMMTSTVATAKVIKKTKTSLTMRNTASSRAASVLVIPKNTTLAVSRSSSGWDQVSYRSKIGWVPANQLTPLKAQTKSMPKTVVHRYLKSFQSLRQKPSATSSSLTGIIRKTKVQRLGSSGSWTRVKVGRSVGFVPTNQLSPAMPAAVYKYSKSKQSLFQKNSSKSKKLATVASGARVEWFRTSGSWAHVSVSGTRGWISAAQLSNTKPVNAKIIGSRWIIADTVLREGNWNKTKSLGTVRSGEKLGLFLTKGSWSKVRTTRGTGWVPTANLTSSAFKAIPATPRWVVKNTALRTGASGSTSKKATVAAREKVTLHGTSNGWSRVKTSKGLGWISSKDLSASKPVSDVLKGNRWAISSVAVRASASSKAKSLGTIRPGSKVGFYRSSGSWSKVKVGRVIGWVPSSALIDKTYLPLNNVKRWATTNVNLREGSSTSFKSLGVVPKNQQVTAHGTANGWTRVTTTQGVGWVSSTYVTSKQPQAPVPDKQQVFRWTTANVNLRAGGGVEHRSLGVVPVGEKVIFLKMSNGWSQIRSSQGTGWVSAKYLATKAPVGLQPDAQRVLKAIEHRFGDTVSNIHTIRSGSVGHSAGKAVDLMIRDYKNKTRIAQGDKIAQFLLDNREQLGVYYLIWQDQIWLPGSGWNDYSTSGKYGTQFTNNWNDTTKHMDHIHVEVYGDSGSDGKLN